MFEKIEASEMMEIIHIDEVEQYRAGAVICSEADAGDAWYVFVQGCD